MERIQVLDHGYVEFIEAWGHGSESSEDYERGIIEAARQSTQGSFRGWEEDKKLLKYLYKNKHYTPFEFSGMVLEIQAPIFVFREWQRHRTQSYNEMSARYAPLPYLNYLPTIDRIMMNSAANKQAGAVKDANEITTNVAEEFICDLVAVYDTAENMYQQYLKLGVPKELARIVLPVGRYSRMRASANLRNWLAFVSLRSDPNAQWEIQQYSNAVQQLGKKYFPKTWENV